MGRLVATIWIGEIALPATRLAKVGLVIPGVVLGLTVKVSANSALVPAALAALRLATKMPLVLGMPVMAPVLWLSVKPGGRPLAL